MVTMADIAKLAGVSRTTTSFVLNGKESELRISDQTRNRVLSAAKELGYRKNEIARAVATGKNFVIGILDREHSIEQRARIMEGALKEANPNGYFIKLLLHPYEEDVLDAAKNCIEQRLAGLIVMLPSRIEMDVLKAELDIHHIPIVTVDDDVSIMGITNVLTNDAQGMKLALDHLVALGHREIVLLSGNTTNSLGNLRERTFKQLMFELGIPIRQENLLSDNGKIERVEALIIDRFTVEQGRPTAILSASGDFEAALAVRALRSIGVCVPKHVSVVGYADLKPAVLIDPPLTTIRQPFEELGRRAFKELLSEIEGGHCTDHQGLRHPRLVDTELIVRKSTARVFQMFES